MSNVTPPSPAAAESETSKTIVVVPESPSSTETSATDRPGTVTPPHGSGAVAVLRGLGTAAAKSKLLLSVSVQPFPARKSAVVGEIAGAGPAPSKKFAVPYPTRSTIWASWAAEHGVLEPLQPTPAVVLATMTLPAAAAMAIVPDASGVGDRVAVGATGRFLDEVVLPRRERPAQGRRGPAERAGPRGARVLHRPSVERHRRGAPVEQLDVVVAQ